MEKRASFFCANAPTHRPRSATALPAVLGRELANRCQAALIAGDSQRIGSEDAGAAPPLISLHRSSAVSRSSRRCNAVKWSLAGLLKLTLA